jgi:hypothetical protein
MFPDRLGLSGPFRAECSKKKLDTVHIKLRSWLLSYSSIRIKPQIRRFWLFRITLGQYIESRDTVCKITIQVECWGELRMSRSRGSIIWHLSLQLAQFEQWVFRLGRRLKATWTIDHVQRVLWTLAPLFQAKCPKLMLETLLNTKYSDGQKIVEIVGTMH